MRATADRSLAVMAAFLILIGCVEAEKSQRPGTAAPETGAAPATTPSPSRGGAVPPPRSPAALAERRIDVTVKRVVDGDTIRVNGVGPGNNLVRLTGINAPETGEGRTTRECFGPEARRWLTDRAPVGARLTLVFDVGERDRFGRLLAYVYASDGAFLNEDLVASGYARTMNIRPNVRHEKDLRAAERRARDERRGLWAACPQR